MERIEPNKKAWIVAASIAFLACALSGAAFAAWVNNGPQILLSIGSSIMAWCM